MMLCGLKAALEATANMERGSEEYYGASEYVADSGQMQMDWSSSANNEVVTKKRSRNDFTTLLSSQEMHRQSAQDVVPQISRGFPVTYEYDDVYPALSSPNGLQMAGDCGTLYTDCDGFGGTELYSAGSALHESRDLSERETEMVRSHYPDINKASEVSSRMSDTGVVQDGYRSADYISCSSNSSTPLSSRNVLPKPNTSNFMRNAHDHLYHKANNSLESPHFEWKPLRDAPKMVSTKERPHYGTHYKKVVQPQLRETTANQRDPHDSIKNEMYNMYVLNSADREELEDRCDNLRKSLEETVATMAENSSRKRSSPEVSWKAEESRAPQKKPCCGTENHVCGQVRRIVGRTRFFFHLYAKQFERFSKNSIAPFRDPDQLTARVTGVNLAIVRECIHPQVKKNEDQECTASTPSLDTGCESNAISCKKRANKFVQTDPFFGIEDDPVNKNVKEAPADNSPATVRPTQTVKKRGNEKPDQPAECQVFLVVKTPECTSAERRWSPRLQTQRKVFYGDVRSRNTKKVKQEGLKQGDALDKEVNCDQRNECSKSSRRDQSPSARRASQRSRCPRRAFSPSHKPEDGMLAVAPVCQLKFVRMSISGRSALDDLKIELKAAKESLEEKSVNSYVQTTT